MEAPEIDQYKGEEEVEYDMTTIRRQHREARKWPWILLVLVMLGIGSFFVFVGPTNQKMRGNPDAAPPEQDENKQAADTDAANEKEGNTPGVRDVKFQVTFLDGQEGETGEFVIRTHADWAPLGVEQFHVSFYRYPVILCLV